MTSIKICLKIAVYEAKILLRSWGFRIFALLGLIIVSLFTAWIAAPSFSLPYFFRSLSGSIPLFSLKLFNVLQGVIVVFMATEFFKRDRRADSTQVIFSRSFSNSNYILGKFLGITALFVMLNILLGVITALIHIFLSETPFNIQAYFVYFLTLILPTLVFLIGLSFVLAVVIRSQAAVILLGLAVSSLSLAVLGDKAYFIPDVFGFHLPLMYSDFIGLGNSAQLFQLRFPFFLLGLGFVFATVLLAKRLRQSTWTAAFSGVLSALFILSAFGLMFNHAHANKDTDKFRGDLLAESQKYAEDSVLKMESCSLEVDFFDNIMSASSEITLKNSQKKSNDSVILTLNPGLRVSRVTSNGRDMDFSRGMHVLLIKLAKPLAPGEIIDLIIEYTGTPLAAYCYLDISTEAFRKPAKLGLYNVPKKYFFLSEEFVHLTSECGWYPRTGIPLSHRFPGAVESDYCRFSLRVSLPEGFTAVSQGLPKIEEEGGRKISYFAPKTPLPQISLTVCPFEERSIKVNDVEYRLLTFPEHDYFAPYFEAVTKDLPKLITQLKDEFEVILGLDYPYKQLSLVEVPIQFYSHKRLWSAASETVQPQIVLLPEMGSLCEGADFAATSRWFKRRRRGKRGREMDSAQIQTGFFNSFVRTNLLGTQPGKEGFRGADLSEVTESDVHAEYNLMPNYFAFTSTLTSDRWPILHSALESWLQDRISAPSFRFDRSGGLTDQEKTNRLLDGHSITELLEDESLEDDQLNDIILAKGKYLMTLIKSCIQEDNFSQNLLDFIKEKKFSPITEEDFLKFLFAFKKFDLQAIMASWYKETQLPAFIIGPVGIYKVQDGEIKRHHIRLQVTNISEVEGIVKYSVMSMQSRMEMRQGGKGWEFEDTVLIPPKTTKEVGILLDGRPLLLQMDTTISRNIPSTRNLPLWERKLEEGDTFYEGEKSTPFKEETPVSTGEYIVDNEDPGFGVTGAEDKWLRSTIRRFFERSRDEEEYLEYNPADPPGKWSPVIFQDFYGKIVLSGYLSEVGEGDNKVSWTVMLPEKGSYEIYFFNENKNQRGGRKERGRGKGNWERPTQEEKNFIVHYEGKTEEIAVDLQESTQGWVLLGTFPLTAGKNMVEQTDKGKGSFLTADAVKWVKTSQN